MPARWGDAAYADTQPDGTDPTSGPELALRQSHGLVVWACAAIPNRFSGVGCWRGNDSGGHTGGDAGNGCSESAPGHFRRGGAFADSWPAGTGATSTSGTQLSVRQSHGLVVWACAAIPNRFSGVGCWRGNDSGGHTGGDAGNGFAGPEYLMERRFFAATGLVRSSGAKPRFNTTACDEATDEARIRTQMFPHGMEEDVLAFLDQKEREVSMIFSKTRAQLLQSMPMPPNTDGSGSAVTARSDEATVRWREFGEPFYRAISLARCKRLRGSVMAGWRPGRGHLRRFVQTELKHLAFDKSGLRLGDKLVAKWQQLAMASVRLRSDGQSLDVVFASADHSIFDFAQVSVPMDASATALLQAIHAAQLPVRSISQTVLTWPIRALHPRLTFKEVYWLHSSISNALEVLFGLTFFLTLHSRLYSSANGVLSSLMKLWEDIQNIFAGENLSEWPWLASWYLVLESFRGYGGGFLIPLTMPLHLCLLLLDFHADILILTMFLPHVFLLWHSVTSFIVAVQKAVAIFLNLTRGRAKGSKKD
ncbi:unnamed protein product [Symbiodinium sp. CCMP2592]|nr:unnamed protein product [Symbiodinium sp. CCMP2592]